MRTNFSEAARIFFSPETLAPFLIGAIFLAVLGNGVTQLLFNWLGTSNQAVIGITLGAVFIFGFSVFLFGIGLSKLRSPAMALDKTSPVKRRGLILLVSQPEPCRKAISYHLPMLKKCWLICSQKTLPLANDLKREFPEVITPDLITINDIYDPLEFFRWVKHIYSRLPDAWSYDDVIADYTGMTAHGSVGMVLATLAWKSPLQYTPAELDQTGKPTGQSLDPIEIALHQQSS